MIKLKKIVKRYQFFLLLFLLNILLLIVEPRLGREAVSLSMDNLLEMLSIIPPIFLLLGLMDVWIPKETIMKYMGKGAGIKGGVFAFVLGSFSSGPLYASFPVAMVFLKKGRMVYNLLFHAPLRCFTNIKLNYDYANCINSASSFLSSSKDNNGYKYQQLIICNKS